MSLDKNDLVPKSVQRNEASIRAALDGWNQPPIDISDPEQVKERMITYFETCAQNGSRPCVSGLCNRLGIHRNTFLAWCNGRERAKTHQDLANKAKGIIEEMLETHMLSGDINVVAGIFLLKNHFGYTDKQEIAVESRSSVTEPTNMDEIMQLANSDEIIEADFEEV